jgi:hypothetical protein
MVAFFLTMTTMVMLTMKLSRKALSTTKKKKTMKVLMMAFSLAMTTIAVMEMVQSLFQALSTKTMKTTMKVTMAIEGMWLAMMVEAA